MEIYVLECPHCRALFEKTEKETSLPPFDTECPNCGATVGSEFIVEVQRDHAHNWQKGYYQRCEECNTVVEGDLDEEEIRCLGANPQISTKEPATSAGSVAPI